MFAVNWEDCLHVEGGRGSISQKAVKLGCLHVESVTKTASKSASRSLPRLPPCSPLSRCRAQPVGRGHGSNSLSNPSCQI